MVKQKTYLENNIMHVRHHIDYDINFKNFLFSKESAIRFLADRKVLILVFWTACTKL